MTFKPGDRVAHIEGHAFFAQENVKLHGVIVKTSEIEGAWAQVHWDWQPPDRGPETYRQAELRPEESGERLEHARFLRHLYPYPTWQAMLTRAGVPSWLELLTVAGREDTGPATPRSGGGLQAE